MLKQRIISAIILIPIFIYLVLFLSIPAFSLLTLLIILIAAFEWAGLMEIKSILKKILYPILIILFLPAVAYIPIKFLLVMTFIWWCSAFLLIITYPNSVHRWGNSKVLRGIMGLLVLIPCWRAINFIHASPGNGPYVLLFIFILIWGADSAAYFVGKKWGKHKLASAVSPGKTWEGFWGAMGCTIILALITLIYSKTPGRIWIPAIFLCLVTVIFSIIGDLFESLLKRKAGLKDSGSLIPGHGGLLDRIDSLTAAVPIFALGAILFL